MTFSDRYTLRQSTSIVGDLLTIHSLPQRFPKMANLLIISVMVLLGVLPHTTSYECSQPVIRNIDVGRGDDIILNASFVVDQSDDDDELSLRSNASGQMLPPCNNRTLRHVKKNPQPCWIYGVSSKDVRSAYEITIRHQTSSNMYSLEITFRNGSVCRIMEINVTVHEKPICTTIYTPMNNTLQLSCKWKPVDLGDGAQLMIGNRLFTGNIMTTNTSATNITDVISTVVSIEDVLSENNVPDLCLVSRNEINVTCNFLIDMKPKEKIFTSDPLMFTCCSSRGNDPTISFYNINGNLWPSGSRRIFVIHEKPPLKCDKKSPIILICANETYDKIIVYGLAKLYLPTQSRILTIINKHEMVETGHCENRFSIDVRPYPPTLIDMTTSSIMSKRNASDTRKRHHLQCQEVHSIASTLTTGNQTSNSRTMYPEGCLDEKHTITRELQIGGCLSFSVYSDQALTGTRKISIRKTVGSNILILCYLFHGTCFNVQNQRLGAIVYDNGTLKVSR